MAFSIEVFDEICAKVMDGGLIVRLLGKGKPKRWPTKQTWYTWLASSELNEKHGLENRWRFALEVRTHGWAEEMITIADDCLPDRDCVSKAKVQIQAREWNCSKAMPGKYGTNVDADGKGGDVHQKTTELYPDVPPPERPS